MTTDKNEAIARIPALAELPEPLRAHLGEMSGLQRISQGAVLFGAGDTCHYVYGLVSGTVALVTSDNGTESIVDFIDSGELVLVPPAILALPYMTSGKAMSDVLALMIPAAAFRDLTATNGDLAASVARMLSLHWRRLLNQMKKLKIGDADMRLAQYLLEHVGPKAASFRLPGSKRQLAAYLGMTPATLSRSFKRLGDFGITTAGSNVTVASLPRLSSFVNSGGHALPAGPRNTRTPVKGDA